MRRVINNQDWVIVDPHEVRTKLGIELADLWGKEFEKAYQVVESEVGNKLQLFKVVKAKDLYKRMMKVQAETGLPFAAFKDNMNRANPNKHLGIIPSANLCVESYSVVIADELIHTCNLASINMANTNLDELPDVCRLAVRILDNLIEITGNPTPENAKHNELLRVIGVGVMGLADYLAKNQKRYTDLDFIHEFAEHFGYWTTLGSVELAQERGKYPAYEGSEWSKGLLINSKPLKWFVENASTDEMAENWKTLHTLISKYGIRNSQVCAVAPNTTSSLLQGCTASILPAYTRFFIEKSSKGNTPISVPFLKDYYWFYQENKYLDQKIVVDAIATLQQYVDTGISGELFFNPNEGAFNGGTLTAKDIYETMVRAWEKGMKTIYYIRSAKKDAGKECQSCAN